MLLKKSLVLSPDGNPSISEILMGCAPDPYCVGGAEIFSVLEFIIGGGHVLGIDWSESYEEALDSSADL